MIKINDLNDIRIKEFTSLKQNKDQNIIIAESFKVVKKLIESKYEIHKIFIDEDKFQEHNDLFHNLNCEIYLTNKKLMESIVGHKIHSGIMASAKLPNLVKIHDLSDQIIILNGLTSPENVGTIVRTARALGIDSLIYDYKTCSPYLRRCVRVSMGNIFRMKIHHTNCLKNTIIELQSNGYQVVGTANESKSKLINNYNFVGKRAIIIGSEGHGMDQEIKDTCDLLLKIAVDEHVEHINASAAAAIFLFELSKSTNKS